MSLDDDIRLMHQALKVATEKGSDPSLSPIGCIIVMDGQILASQRNHVAEKHDAMAHAEIESMREADRAFENGELRGATLYCTLQPCGMCTMASIWSKVGRIVYGAGREDVHEMDFEARHVDTLHFAQKAYRNDRHEIWNTKYLVNCGLIDELDNPNLVSQKKCTTRLKIFFRNTRCIYDPTRLQALVGDRRDLSDLSKVVPRL